MGALNRSLPDNALPKIPLSRIMAELICSCRVCPGGRPAVRLSIETLEHTFVIMKTRAIFIFIHIAILVIGVSASCPFSPWFEYRGATILRHDTTGVYAFVTDHIRIDADGAPNAYHPSDIGLDYLANAGYHPDPDKRKSWWSDVLVEDPAGGGAFVQPSGALKGYFISKTALFDGSASQFDPLRYVDATRYPYLVFPSEFNKLQDTGSLGDVGYAVNLDDPKFASPFIVADIGPAGARLGEVSVKLAEALGGNSPDPRTGSGSPKGRMLYVVFPVSRSAPAWPRDVRSISSQVRDLLKKIGGGSELRRCIE
jgi:hypothetical protein